MTRGSHPERHPGSYGYSTMVDALAFLALVSVAALVLAPVLFAPDPGPGPGEQVQMARAALVGLVDARVEEFNYTLVPGFVEEYVGEMGGNLGASELLSNLLTSLFGHQLRHRTYADLLCDYAACQFYLGIGEGAGLNPLAGSYRSRLDAALGAYFSRVLGPAYGWRVQVVWEPFAGVPVGGYAAFGHPAPPAAWCAGIEVTMPHGAALDRDELREVLAPYAANLSGGPGGAEVRRLAGSAFEELADRALNSTVMPRLRGLFEWVEDFSGATRLLRLNESMRSDVAIEASLGYELDAGGGNQSGRTRLEVDGLREMLRRMVVECNRAYLDGFSQRLSGSLADGGVTEAEVLERLCEGPGGRFPVSRARLSLQVWEVG